MSEYVLDAYAILALLQKEPGYGRVEALLKSAMEGEAQLHISAFNMAEVHCIVLKHGNNASRILAALEALPLNVASADAYLGQAAELKAKYGMAMGSAFAAALAQDIRRPLISGDREFRKLGTAVSIEWLR